VGVFAGPDVSESGLVLTLDAGNTKGYDNDENLFLYSEQYDQLVWVNQASSETINTTETLSPDGTYNATKLFGNNGATTRQSIYQAVSVTSGITYTFSVFLKQGQRRYATIWFDSANVSQGAFRGAGSIIDLQTGTLATGNETIIVPYSNGWYRCYVIATPTATQSMNFNLSVGGPNNNNGAPYDATGDGSSGLYIGRSQFERGILTDYTPTTTTAKNRGTTLTDLSGNGNTGTLVNGVGYNSGNGGSLSFDGTDDYILGTIPSSTFSGAHSICCWFYRETVTEWAGLFSNNVNTTSCSIFTFITTSNSLGTNQAGVNGTSIAVDLGADHLNKWIYAVITYAGSTNGSAVNVYAYKDGSLLTATGSLYWNLSSSSSYYIGRHWTSGSQILDGFIPQVSIYNRALTAAEIQQNYNATKSRYGL
jgi:hypothetical protein